VNAPISPTEQLAFATVRIESHFTDGDMSCGTGFFFDLAKLTSKQAVPVLVTNRHVVEGASQGHFALTLSSDNNEPLFGDHVRITVPHFSEAWIGHPDPTVDLCVLPIGALIHQARRAGHAFFYTVVREDFLPSEDEISDYVGMEEIAMVGYPIGLWDEINNRPIFRRGILASDYRTNWKGRQEFLIDAACFPGSSGSPIFLHNPMGYETRQGIVSGNGRIKLLGILTSGPQFNAHGEIKVIDVPTQQKTVSVSAIPMNLGIAIKSGKLQAFQENIPAMFAAYVEKQEQLRSRIENDADDI
jgi:hypothetical protein